MLRMLAGVAMVVERVRREVWGAHVAQRIKRIKREGMLRRVAGTKGRWRKTQRFLGWCTRYRLTRCCGVLA